jgi:hypothetical protein
MRLYTANPERRYRASDGKGFPTARIAEASPVAGRSNHRHFRTR